MARWGGLGLAVLSAATFGTSGTFGTSLMAAGWSPAGAVTIRVSLAALVLTLPAVLQLRGRWHTLRRSRSAVIAFGLVAVAGCQLCYFNAFEHLSVSVALLLEYSGTLLVVLWMWLVHGRRPGRLTAVGGLAAVVGLALVLDLTGSQHISLVGLLWGLGAATGLAVYFVVSAGSDTGPDTGDTADEPAPPLAMAWAAMVVGSLALILAGACGLVPWHASTADVRFAGHRMSWVVPVLGLAVLAGALAYAVGIAAARRLGATLATFLGLTEVLFAAGFAWGLLGQRPTLLQAMGGLAVLVGIALVRADEGHRLADFEPCEHSPASSPSEPVSTPTSNST